MSKKLQKPSTACNGIMNFGSRYALTRTQANSLLTELNSATFLSNIQLLFSSPVDNIVSMYAFPFDTKAIMPVAGQVDDGTIIVNVVEMTTTGGYLNPETVPILDIGSATITPHFNSFLDYAPYTQIEIFLPYIGFEQLDTELVMGKAIYIKYVVDYYSGKCTAFVSAGTGDDETIILQRDGQIGISVQIGGGASAEIARNMLKLGISTGAGALSGIAGGTGSASGMMSGLANTTIGAITAGQVHVQKGGSSSPNNAFYAPQNAYLIITRPIISRPATYDSTVGRPSGVTAQLSTLTGYTVVDAVHVEGLGQATRDEITEVERLLKAGVIL